MTEINLIKALPLIAFCILLLLQTVLPRRKRTMPSGGSVSNDGAMWHRVLHNFLLFLVNSLLMRLLVPLTLASAAVWASSNNWGVFNSVGVPAWFEILVCVVVLDFAIYWQHVATHKIPVLWRMHKVHHADKEMDVTTAIRFHPFELLLSLLYKSVAVIVLGASVSSVLLFELLLFIGPAFNHSNLRLPRWLDQILRWVVVTPDTHRAHHSVYVSEQDTNYGFFLIWWDKLFGTYTKEPKDGHSDMQIGLKAPEDQCQRLDELLLAPFR